MGEVVVDMVATEGVKVDMEVDHMEVANKVDMEVAREVMVVEDEEADMVVAADTVVAKEDMVEEEHKATIKAFKHFSSPPSLLQNHSHNANATNNNNQPTNQPANQPTNQ